MGVTSVSSRRENRDPEGAREHKRYERQVTVDSEKKPAKKQKPTSEATLTAARDLPENAAEKLEYGKATFT